MSGARQTTSSLKDKIRQAANQRDIALDAINVVEDGDQRRFRVLETDAETEADQVGFEIVAPGGPSGDMMFNRRLQQYMDELKKHVRGEDAETVADDDTESDTEREAQSASPSFADTDDEDTTSNTDYAGPGPTEGREMNPSADEVFASAETADVTIAFDNESIDDLVTAVEETVDDATADQAEVEARLDDLEERIRQIENALSAISHVSQPDE